MRKNFLGTENDYLNTIAKIQNISLWGEKHKYKNYYFERLCSEIHICPFQKVKGMQKITSFFILGLLVK